MEKFAVVTKKSVNVRYPELNSNVAKMEEDWIIQGFCETKDEAIEKASGLIENMIFPAKNVKVVEVVTEFKMEISHVKPEE